MKAIKTTLSKTIKVPITGINFSNKVVSATIEYEGEVDMIKAKDELNQALTVLKNDDPEWVTPSKEVEDGKTRKLGV